MALGIFLDPLSLLTHICSFILPDSNIPDILVEVNNHNLANLHSDSRIE